MMNGFGHWYFCVFFCGLAATLFTTPIAQKLAVYFDLMDRPKSEKHKGHAKATPLLGGLALFSGLTLCLAGGLALLYFGAMPRVSADFTSYVSGAMKVTPQLLWLLCGAAMAVVLGLLDDKYGMSAAKKFGGQFLIALVAVLLGGVRIQLFLPAWAGVAITVFWYMLLMNSINFFDNMDGLAVGTITLAMLFFGMISACKGQLFVAGFSFLCAGNGAGFWFYNHNPASIFMGDSGSHLLGYLAATVSASVTYFSLDASLSRFPVLVPLFILAVPLFDTAMVVLIRTMNRKPFWIGDHNHISHRFEHIGLTRKQAVAAVHLLVLISGLGAFPIIWGSFKVAAVVVLQLFLVLALVSYLQFTLTKKEDNHE